MYKLLWFELFWILLIGIFIIFPGKIVSLTWHPYWLLALFLFWPFWLGVQLLRCRDNNVSRISPLFVKHPIAVPLLFIICWLFVNVWASTSPDDSWIAAGYLLLGIILFTTSLQWLSAQHDPSYLAFLLLLFGEILAIVALPFVEWKPQFRLFHLPLYDRLQSLHIDLGETIHANILAGVLVLVLPVYVALILFNNCILRRWQWYLCGGLSLIIFTNLILTQSRGGYLAMVVAILILLLLRWPRLSYFLPLVLLGTLVLIYWIGLQTVLEQFSSDSSLGGWDGRLDIWLNSLQAISDFSFTGIGIGTFTIVMPLLYPLQVSIEGYPHAHNLFLQIALDLGLPGLIAYLAIIINLFVMLIATLRSKYTTPLHRTLAIGCTGSLVGMLVHGLLDAVTWGTKLAFVPWILFALITQLFLHTQAAQRDAST